MNKKEIYAALAEAHGWCANTVAELTPIQQLIYLEKDMRNTVIFNSASEAMEFSRKIKQNAS